jgi:hypothetical protein
VTGMARRTLISATVAALLLLPSPAAAMPDTSDSGAQPVSARDAAMQASVSDLLKAFTPPGPLDLTGTLVGAPADGLPMPRFRLDGNPLSQQDAREKANRAKIVGLVEDSNKAAATYDEAVTTVTRRTKELATSRAVYEQARANVAKAEQEARDFAAAVAMGRYTGQANKLLESMYSGEPADVVHAIEAARAADAWKGDAIVHRDEARIMAKRAADGVIAAVGARQAAVDALGDALTDVRAKLQTAAMYVNGTPGVGELAAVFPEPASAADVRVGAIVDQVTLRKLGTVVLDPSPETVTAVTARFPGSAVATMSTVTINGRRLVIAGIDPDAARSFAPSDAAYVEMLWRATARGELVVTHAASGLADLQLGEKTTAEPTFFAEGVQEQVKVTVGGYATLDWPGVDAVTSVDTVKKLGGNHTMMLVATGDDVAQALIEVRKLAGSADVVPVATMSPSASQFLSEQDARSRIGDGPSFRAVAGGWAVIDDAWVNATMVTQSYPIVGDLRCHKAMVAQLRGALTELEARGLGGKLSGAGGCFTATVDRDDPKKLSAAGWGLSVRLLPTGDPQQIMASVEPAVAAVMRRWGFRQSGESADNGTFTLAAVLR